MDKILSPFAKLNAFDFAKSILLAFIVSVLTGLYTSLESGHFPENWQEWRLIFLSALTSAIGYILKNLFTNSNGEFGTKENPKP